MSPNTLARTFPSGFFMPDYFGYVRRAVCYAKPPYAAQPDRGYNAAPFLANRVAPG